MVTRRTATLALLSAIAAPTLAVSGEPRSVRMPTRGFAIPDWIAAEPRIPSIAWLEALREHGFETVRLAVDPRQAGAEMPARVSSAITVLSALGFDTIVDLHAGDASASEIEAAWRVLAPVVADTDPDRIFIELLNEPAFETSEWVPLRDGLAGTVRAQTSAHTLIWGPARYQGIWELDHEPPLDDRNSIAAIHYYWPMAFTHQCESWMDSALSRIGNLPFPASRESAAVEAVAAHLDADDRAVLDAEFASPWSTAIIDVAFARAADWSRRTGVPLMLGEFGVLDFCVDPTSRATWIATVRRAAEAHGMGWVYWEADQGFGFTANRAEAQGFDTPAIAALLG